MAFNFKTFAAVGALIGSLALVGCGQDEKDPNHIKVGVIVGAEQQVAEVAQKVAKEKYGLDVELVTFNDYVLPNEALSKGDIDVNAFQHKPYLDQQLKTVATSWLPWATPLSTRLPVIRKNQIAGRTAAGLPDRRS
jgi:D-methionine transport system substrate-binding protein